MRHWDRSEGDGAVALLALAARVDSVSWMVWTSICFATLGSGDRCPGGERCGGGGNGEAGGGDASLGGRLLGRRGNASFQLLDFLMQRSGDGMENLDFLTDVGDLGGEVDECSVEVPSQFVDGCGEDVMLQYFCREDAIAEGAVWNWSGCSPWVTPPVAHSAAGGGGGRGIVLAQRLFLGARFGALVGDPTIEIDPVFAGRWRGLSTLASGSKAFGERPASVPLPL